MLCTSLGIASGILTGGVVGLANMERWQALLIACIPPLVGLLCDWLRKKFKINITKDTEKKISDTAIDLVDDGKLNGSNKKGVKKEDGENRPN